MNSLPPLGPYSDAAPGPISSAVNMLALLETFTTLGGPSGFGTIGVDALSDAKTTPSFTFSDIAIVDDSIFVLACQSW
jgi:hypothetical protein